MTVQKQGQRKTAKTNTKFNRTPKKFNGPKGTTHTPKKARPIVIRQRDREYICTSCDKQVVKSNSCGKILKEATKSQPAQRAGLGKFKCFCGNKTVRVKLLKAEKTGAAPEVAAAA